MSTKSSLTKCNLPMLDKIFSDFKNSPSWILFEINEVPGGKLKKVPVFPYKKSGAGSWQNSNDRICFDEIHKHLSPQLYPTIVLESEMNLVCIDLDNALDRSGNPTAGASDILDLFPDSFTEVSVSGKGLHIWISGLRSKVSPFYYAGQKVEIYNQNRCMILTGSTFPGKPSGTLHLCDDELSELLSYAKTTVSGRQARENVSEPQITPELRRALRTLDSDSYDIWIKVGMGLRNEFGDSGLEIWDRWSATSTKYDRTEIEYKWKSFNTIRKDVVTLKSIFWLAQKVTGSANQSDSKPTQEELQRLFCEGGENKILTLTYNGELYLNPSSDQFLEMGCDPNLWSAPSKDQLYAVIDKKFKLLREERLVSNLKITSALIKTAAELIHIRGVPRAANVDGFDQWIDSSEAEHGDYIRTNMGIFNLRKSPEDAIVEAEANKLKYSANWFTTLTICLESNRPPPLPIFKRFVNEIYEEDPQKINTLQEFMGYCLSPHSWIQRALFLNGRKRSGKSTILAVLQQMFGRHFVSTSIEQLGGPFGMQNLPNSRVLALTELSGGSGWKQQLQQSGLENLKRITGGDSVSVNRKHLPEVTVKALRAKVIVTGNEIPSYNDPDGAIASRMICIHHSKSFYQKEDPHLFTKLQKEITGIFFWAWEGYRRLYLRGAFEESPSLDLSRELSMHGNHIEYFLQEAIVADEDNFVSYKDIYAAYEEYCSVNMVSSDQILPERRLFGQIKNSKKHWSVIDKRRGQSRGLTGIKISPDYNVNHADGA